MRIEVLQIDSTPPPRVYFRTALGQAWGYWFEALPTTGQSYDVEITVDDELEWGRNIRADAAHTAALSAADNGVELIARLEALEPDGVVFLRMGNSLLMVEADGEDAPPVGSMVRLQVDAITLSDIRT